MPETPDLVQERLAKLKEIMPDIFTDEGMLDEKQLRQIIEMAYGEDKPAHAPETYEFNWFGKAKAKEQAYTPTRLTLQYDPERSFNPENSENVIIEGENLEVLKLLLCGYRGRIKCIYIDPPYNTGKDFVYSDKHAIEYKEYLEKTGKMRDGIKTDANAATSGRYHSDWLSMMYSRLIVAQQLLKKDGVIFISIDDNEVHNLRKLCDEVFGADNFVANIIWHSKYTIANDAKYLSRQHENVLLFAKSLDDFEVGLLERTAEMDAAYKNPDNDKRGPWKATPIHAKSGSATYEFEFPNGKVFSPPMGTYPRYSKARLLELYNDDRLYFSASTNGVSRKTFLSEVKDGKTAGSVWSYEEVGSSHAANEQLSEVLGRGKFDNPKPIDLIKQCFKVANLDDDIVLDFFAGSGTTGHATSDLNFKDGASNKYILVQLPEETDSESEPFKAGFKKISDITIARNRKVAEKLPKEANAGFKVFTLEKSYFPRTEWAPEPGMDEAAKIASLKAYIAEKEQQQKLDLDADKLLTEVLVKEGFMLTYKAVRRDDFPDNNVYDVTDGEKTAVVCLDPTLADATVKQLRQLIDKKVVVIERALDTTKKWNLHNSLGERFKAF